MSSSLIRMKDKCKSPPSVSVTYRYTFSKRNIKFLNFKKLDCEVCFQRLLKINKRIAFSNFE